MSAGVSSPRSGHDGGCACRASGQRHVDARTWRDSAGALISQIRPVNKRREVFFSFNDENGGKMKYQD